MAARNLSPAIRTALGKVQIRYADDAKKTTEQYRALFAAMAKMNAIDGRDFDFRDLYRVAKQAEGK